MTISIDNEKLAYEVKGETFLPSNQILSRIEDDLTVNTSWQQQGFSVCPLYSGSDYHVFQNIITQLLKTRITQAGINISEIFQLSDYHNLIASNNDLHLNVIKNCVEIESKYFPLGFEKIEKRISEILDIPVECRKPMNNERVFHFRIIRPDMPDYNPLHKDVWLDELKDAITIYIPITGSNEKSSLLLAEGSHLDSESNFIRTKSGALMNGVQFNVPGLIESKTALKFVRPNPMQNEVLVFSPYLIHGGTKNLNTDTTRISLEMRFWRKVD